MQIIKYLKKFSPSKEKLNQYQILKMFGSLIHDPNLWHFNRHSVAKAFSVGLFFAWIPVPFQMALAAWGAIIFKANLPLSVALVWLTNPITMPPLFWFSYIIGTKILGTPIRSFNFELSASWLHSVFKEIWQPFTLGCLICAITSAIVSNIIIRLLWRLMIIKNWQKRTNRTKNKKKLIK